MAKQVEVVSLDGGAKSGKSTIGNAIAKVVTPHRRVKVADAGAYYRRNTVGAFDFLGIDGSGEISEQDLDTATAAVVKSGLAFNDDFEWGDLERPEVQKWVSRVGRRPLVQQAAKGWFEVTVTQAEQDADVLIINARNPRLHMAQWLANGPLRVAVELYVDCEPEEAARRKLIKEGVFTPDQGMLDRETLEIYKRRYSDLTRPTDKFRLPEQTVDFDLGYDLAETVAASRHAAPDIAPLPISFDTTYMPFEEMELAAQGLALTALRLC
ncbi:MAG TPA: (d)CMP kinase [Bacillota bacterium]|nr:(d)CMP kinase [Bacillota bacterium]